MKRMHLFIFSLLVFYIIPQAQDIPLSGRVIDENSNPVQNAKVALKNAALSTTTDAEGLFAFSTTHTIKTISGSPSEYLVIQNGVMHVKTHGSKTGEIAIYDYTGRKAAILFTGKFQEGDNTITVSDKINGLASSIYIVTATIGGRPMFSGCYYKNGRIVIYMADKNTCVKNNFLAKAMAGIDQLSVSAAGYRDTIIDIKEYAGDMGAIVLRSAEGCGAGGWSAGDHKLTLTHDGLERTYEVHIPQSYTKKKPVPLMMVIHGAHNTIAMVRSWSKMNSVADENGFIVVYPQGIDCWNCGFTIGGCPTADDDVGFLRAVVSEVKKNTCIDPKRVYATGISNGSMMAQFLGCTAADLFAAVGGVSGGVSGSCTPSRPISVFYVHGTVDKTIPYSSAQPNIDGWVKRNNCSSTPEETYNVGSTRCVTYKDCNNGTEVVFCTVTGMGHCWPEDKSCLGTGDNPGDFTMSPMNWEFFKRFTLP